MKRFGIFILGVVVLGGMVVYGQTESGGPAKKKQQEDQQLEEAVRLAVERLKQNEAPAYVGELEDLHMRQQAIAKEIAYIREKIGNAKKKLIGAQTTGDEAYITKWTAEVNAWEGRLKYAEDELARYQGEIGNVAQTIRATVGGGDMQDDVILPGETLEIYVAEDDLFNGLYQVRRGGYVIFPQLGRVSVAGKTQQGAEKELKGRLEESQLRQATVMVERVERLAARQNRGQVYLVGDWIEYNTYMSDRDQTGAGYRVPGVQPLPRGNATVVTTILRYRVKPYADLEHVKLLRLVGGKGLVEEVNVKAVLEGDELASDISLQPEDIVIVPRRGDTNHVYLTGAVSKKQTILTMPPNEELTVYKAILRSGGFGRFANDKKVFVLRDLGSGQKTRIPVNLDEVVDGRIPDLVLQPNDIIVVPEKFFSF